MSFLKKLFGTKASVDSEFIVHKDKIYPWVKVVFEGDYDPRNTPVQLELDNINLPINKSWLADLSVFYVVDEGDSFRVLAEKDLPVTISEDELHETAIANLNRDVTYTMQETNFGGYGLIAGGDHEAGSICLPGVWEWLSAHFNNNLIVAIPAKDLVWIVPENDTEGIDNLKIAVHEMFKVGDRLLTRHIFRFDKTTTKWSVIDMVGGY
jgi:uncharacterized protein YtpQ (UPF0354 family)